MSGAFERLREECRKILGISVFFAVLFCLIVLTDKLLVEGSNVEVTSFAKAIIGGLLVAKVLLLVDLLPFVNAFPHKPLIYNIVWKSLLYIAASLVFHYVEPVIESLLQGESLASANRHTLQAFTQPIFWANEIWVAMLLVLFVTIRELSHALGPNEFRRLFFGERQPQQEVISQRGNHVV